MHGFAGWFDLEFIGTDATVKLSTAPDQPGTHWYQVSHCNGVCDCVCECECV